MVVVTKKPGESDDRLIARFKKKVLDSGIIIEARERSQYIPESEKRKQKKYRIKHLQELERKRNK
jgi:ribosomal protein S21